MARRTEDLLLAMHLLAGQDEQDFLSPPVPWLQGENSQKTRVAFFTNNGIAQCTAETETAIRRRADFLSQRGMIVEEKRPPAIEQVFELELSILGADGGDGIFCGALGNPSGKANPMTTGSTINRNLNEYASTSNTIRFVQVSPPTRNSTDGQVLTPTWWWSGLSRLP